MQRSEITISRAFQEESIGTFKIKDTLHRHRITVYNFISTRQGRPLAVSTRR